MTRASHINRIKKAIRIEMDQPTVHCRPYKNLLEIMNNNSKKSFHRLTTTNWDYLPQREIDLWIKNRSNNVVPKFLGGDGCVWHFNGSVERGYINKSPFLLETDEPRIRKRTFEGQKAFQTLFWSNIIVVVGVSFEARIDKGLLGALKTVEDETPIGNAIFLNVDPSKSANDQTFGNLAQCFPRAHGIQIFKGFEDWVNEGMPELKKLKIFQ